MNAPPPSAASNARIERGHAPLFRLVAIALFVLFGVTLPLGLMSLEDNVDGLSGYIAFFAGICLIAACPYALLCWAAFRFSGPALRTALIWAGMTVLLMGLIFGIALRPGPGVLDNFYFSEPLALKPSRGTLVLDLAVVIIAASGSAALLKLNAAQVALRILILTCVLTSLLSVYSLTDRIYRKSEREVAGGTFFSFSKRSPNVLLLFVDGAMSGYLPGIFADQPDLIRQLEGFVWYSNVVSTGNRTINGLPAVFGGFDYTVTEVNRRSGSLKDKVSAAYKVYADNFSAKDYAVLYSDPFWFGLQRAGDCEWFNEIYQPDGKARCIHSIGKQIEARKAQFDQPSRMDQFAGLARQYAAITLFRVAPFSLRETIYDAGGWLGLSYAWKKKEDKYLRNFLSLVSYGELSDTSSSRPTFTFITNEMPRAPLFLRPDCLPDRSLTAESPDIKPIVVANTDADTAAIYQTTKCMMIGLGRFMDWMRGAGIYDNSMIVIVSDHGWVSHNPLLKNVGEPVRYSMFQSFLMVKEFGQRRPLRESHEFIANANVPGVICQTIGGCIDGETGKRIVREPLKGPVLLHETPWNPAGQRSDAYVIEALHSVSDDICRAESWRNVSLDKGEVGQPSTPSVTSTRADEPRCNSPPSCVPQPE